MNRYVIIGVMIIGITLLSLIAYQAFETKQTVASFAETIYKENEELRLDNQVKELQIRLLKDQYIELLNSKTSRPFAPLVPELEPAPLNET